MPQHPSWKMAAIVVLKMMMKKTMVWKTARTKLILAIADGPKHSLPPPDWSGH